MLAVARLAGADLPHAVVLGTSMTLLQFAIGALNDLVDAPRDAGHRLGKPIPDGVVSAARARRVVLGCAGAGVILAGLAGGAVSVVQIGLPSGLLLAAVAALVLGIGALYDLRLKGTTLSWLPFAVGIPILPVYGWLGATGSLPAIFGLLVPVAVLVGAGLALSNALVDLERDRAAGIASPATALGAARTAALVVGLDAAVALAAVGLAAGASVTGLPLVATAGSAGLLVGAAVLGVAWRDASPARRERAWQAQAVGAGLLAVVAVAGLVDAGAFAA